LPALRCTKVWQQRYASAHQLPRRFVAVVTAIRST
jgi:hypothetical protein